MNYKKLADRVRYFKEDEEGIKAMCRSMEEFAKSWAAEEVQEEREAVALRMLDMKETDFEKIANVSKLSVKEVEKLAEMQPV